MERNIDAIYTHICHPVRWVVCPFYKYLAKILPVAKGVINMISALSPLSWWRLLQKALLHMQEGEVFEETGLEWLEFSRRTTVLLNSFLKEFEALLEQFQEDTIFGVCSDYCSVATIKQCNRTCNLSSKKLTTNYDIAMCQNSTKALLPNSTSSGMEQFDKPKSTRHWFRAVAPLCSHQQQHVSERGAYEHWRRLLLVIRIVRVLLSLRKARVEQSNCPAKSRVYTPVSPPLLPCPPSCIQTRPERAEDKPALIMMFSQGPQIHLISQELRVKLESSVRRKLTHRLFGFPSRLVKLLGNSAEPLLKYQDTGDGSQVQNFAKTKLKVDPNRNIADLKDTGLLNDVDLKDIGRQKESAVL